MPRERRRAPRAPRTPYRTARGSGRQAGSAAAASSPAQPKLFRKLLAKSSLVLSNAQQRNMADTLRQHLFKAVAMFQDRPIAKRSLSTRQQQSSVKTRQHGASAEAGTLFADFYETVHRMTVNKSKPTVYEVTNGVMRESFDAFATALTTQTMTRSSASSLAPAEALIAYHGVFFGPTLDFIAAALAPAERRSLANPAKPVLLHELACRAFIDAVIGREPIRAYLIELVAVFFARSRQRYQDEFLKGALQSTGTIPSTSLAEYFQATFRQSSRCSTIHALLQILLGLERVNQSIFSRLVELPLVKRTVAQARQLSREQLSTTGLSMTAYLRWVASYLTIDRHLLEVCFTFPPASVKAMCQVLVYVMASKQMDSILDHPQTGFGALLTTQSYGQLRALYEQLSVLDSAASQTTIIDALLGHIDGQLTSARCALSSKYTFKRRPELLAFVEELLHLKTQWDTLLDEVFSVSGNGGHRALDLVNQVVFKFFYDSLLLHESVPQALALYLHSAMLKKNPSNGGNPSGPIALGKLRYGLFQNDARFASQYQLLSLVQYMKDVNTFYDYCKHYFCARLLASNGSSPNGSFTLEEELSYFGSLTSEIKRVFVDDPALVNSPYASLIHRHHSMPSTDLVHKHFTQSLNDFEWIAADWLASPTFWASSEPADRQVGFLNSFNILHAGIWKLIEYDHCKVPESLQASFRRLEARHRAKWSNKRLLLNTKASKATIEARFWSGQPEPLSLTVSLHQLAIIEQFNGDLAEETPGSLSFEQLHQGAAFLKEANSKLALLSLVYGGLLKAETSTPTVTFELNGRRFYEGTKSVATGGRTKDLSVLEEKNYWTEDGTVDLKTAHLAVALGIAEEDIYLAATNNSVEDVGANCALILRTDLPVGGGAQGGEGTTPTFSSTMNQASTSNVDFSANSPNGGRSGSETSSLASMAPSVSSESRPVVKYAIDREIKLEAAIVRVTKRARRLASLHEIYLATKTELATGRAPFPASEAATIEEVSKGVLKLVEKKYIKRTQMGGFEFIID